MGRHKNRVVRSQKRKEYVGIPKKALLRIITGVFFCVFLFIILCGALMFCAEKLSEAIYLKEIFFWSTMILIIILPQFSRILQEMLDEIIKSRRCKNGKSK